MSSITIALPKTTLSVPRKCDPTNGFVSVLRIISKSKTKTLSNWIGIVKLGALPGMPIRLQRASAMVTSSEQDPTAEPVLNPKEDEERTPEVVDDAHSHAKAAAAVDEAGTGQGATKCVAVGVRMASALEATNANSNIHRDLAASQGANPEVEL